MSATRYPHRIESVHVELIDDELCVYDTSCQRVSCVESHGGVCLAAM